MRKFIHTRNYKQFAKNLYSRKLLYKLTTECTFSATGKLRKQVDGISMGGTLSVILSDCFTNKMERDIVLPLRQNATVDSLMTPTGEESKMNQMNYFRK